MASVNGSISKSSILAMKQRRILIDMHALIVEQLRVPSSNRCCLEQEIFFFSAVFSRDIVRLALASEFDRALK